MIHFSGCALNEACTIIIRGATQQILEEAERSLHDALCVLTQTVKETRTVFGGGLELLRAQSNRIVRTRISLSLLVYSVAGASELLMAKAVGHLASKTPGKESRAIESFANALRQVFISLL